MKTSTEFLPPRKQEELKRLVALICQYAKVEMIILFGSYARNSWVEEGKIGKDRRWHEYHSDYDILVVTDTEKRAQSISTWDKVERAIERCKVIHTWVNLICHDIKELNLALERGHYFFNDIKKEGILLYDSGRFKLANMRDLTIDERYQDAKENFDYWFSSAKGFFSQHVHAVETKHLAIAAFVLHQAVERAYAAVLLVFTSYKPRSHSLEKLGRQVAIIDKRLYAIFPQGTPEEKRLFELLKKAYIDARYKKSYHITQEELKYLSDKVTNLHQLIDGICQAYIKKLAP